MITPETMQAKIDAARKKLEAGFDNMDLIEMIQSQLTRDEQREIERVWGSMDERSTWLDAVKEIAEPGRRARLKYGRKVK